MFEDIRKGVSNLIFDTSCSDFVFLPDIGRPCIKFNKKSETTERTDKSPIFFEGRATDECDEDVDAKSLENFGSSVTVNIFEAGTAIKTYDDDYRKTTGIIQFFILSRFGDAENIGRARRIADSINTLITNRHKTLPNSGGQLYTRAGSLRKVNENKSGYQEYKLDVTFEHLT